MNAARWWRQLGERWTPRELRGREWSEMPTPQARELLAV